jgi:hypothetical protein
VTKFLYKNLNNLNFLFHQDRFHFELVTFWLVAILLGTLTLSITVDLTSIIVFIESGLGLRGYSIVDVLRWLVENIYLHHFHQQIT